MSDNNNDLGLVKDAGDSQATMDHPHDDLGLVTDHQATPDPALASHDTDLGIQHDLNPVQAKKDTDDLGIQSEHGDIFAGPKQEWYTPAVRAVEGAADAFMGHFSKASPLGIGERIANPSQDVLTPKQQSESQDNPAAAFLGEAAGSAATYAGAAAIPAVSLPIAFGAANVLSGVADQADTIKDANNQLSIGQRIGKVGVDAVAGAITGGIFTTASKGATILDRVIERSGGAGATAISQSIANQAVEGKEPDVGQAIAAGGLQAVSIGIVGGMAEVPELRGLVMDQAKALVSKDGTVMGNTGPYKVDPDNLTIDQAKKILTDSTINPESLAPEFQQAQYDIKKQIAMDNLDAKSKQYGVDPDIMKQVMNAQDQRTREGILQNYLTSMIKTDPKTAEKLLPFFDAIKKGADPADIIIMSDMLQKFNAKTEVSQTVGENANESTPEIKPNAENAPQAAVTPQGATEQNAKLPQSEGNEKTGIGDASTPQAGIAGLAAGGGSSALTSQQSQIPQFKSTEEALQFGKDNKNNPDTLKQLSQLRQDSLDRNKTILAKGDEASDDELKEAMNEGVRGQFYREALESAHEENTKELGLQATSTNKDLSTEILNTDKSDIRYKNQPSWDYLKKDKDEYEAANKQGLALIKKHLPQLSDSLVNPAFIPTKDGSHAIGAYYRGRIYVKTGQGLNVYVHEMGHAVFDLFLAPEEKSALIAEGKKIYGQNADVEERIMRDFEKYAQDGRFIPDDSVWGKIKGFFKRLADRLRQFVGINPSVIKSFYDAILSGEFKDATPRKDYSTQAGADTYPAYKTEDPFKGPTLLDPAIAAVAKSYKEIISLVAPRALVPRESLDMIMKMKGERDKLEFILENRLKALEKTFDRMSNHEKIDFVDRIKTGQTQPSQALQTVADMMRTIEDKYWAQAKEFKPSLAYKENHFRVMWKVIPGSPEARGFHGLFKRPFQGTQGWSKKSTLADMSEGIKAGGIPYSYNPMTMWKNSIMDMQKFITARRMWNNLKQMGMVKFVRAGESVDPGMVLVDDKISHVYLPVEATPVGAPEGTSSFPATVEMGKYYVEEASGRILNNFLGRDYIRESQIGGNLLALKNFTTGIELSLSPFHAAYVSLMASSSNMGLGLQKIANRGLIHAEGKAFLDGLKDIAYGAVPLAGPARYFDIGTKAIQYVSHDDFIKSKAGQDFIKAFPEATQLLDDLFTGGGKLAIHQDYKINALKAFTQGIRDFGDAKRSFLVAQENKDSSLMQKYALEMANNAWAEVVHLLPSVNQMIMSPLFEVYIPRLKIGAFLQEYSNDLIARRDQLESGRITRAQLARDTWDSVERRFGEMNFDNLFWNRNFKTALQLAFRSVTWKLGALQNIGGAGTGTIQDLAIAIQDKQLPKLNRNLAMLLGLGLMVTLFAEVMQQLLTGKNLGQRDDGKEDFGLLLKDILDPRYNKNGDRLFFNTHLKDWAHLFHSPGGFVSNSLSGIWGRLFEDWNNKDFFNTQIHNPHDPVYKQGWDMLVHLMPLPFMITNQYQLKMKNAPAAVKTLTAMGFTTPAPGYVNDTPVYQLAQELMKDKPFANITKTKDQEAKYQYMSTLRQNYAATHDSTPLQAAERAGQISFKQYMNIKKEAGMSPLQRIASSHQMNFDDISQLMQKAIETKSVDEQNTLWPIFREKYFSGMEHTPMSAGNEDRRNDMKAVYNDIKTKIGK